jgi:hypothetical protein
MRITMAMLEQLCDDINHITDSPVNPYTESFDGYSIANIGNYHITTGYGGYNLHRINNEGGGLINPIREGHYSKRELYYMMYAYYQGLKFKEELLCIS